MAYSSLCAFAIIDDGADTMPSAPSPFLNFWIRHCSRQRRKVAQLAICCPIRQPCTRRAVSSSVRRPNLSLASHRLRRTSPAPWWHSGGMPSLLLRPLPPAAARRCRTVFARNVSMRFRKVARKSTDRSEFFFSKFTRITRRQRNMKQWSFRKTFNNGHGVPVPARNDPW